MKKNLFKLTAITLASFLLFSCSSSDDDNNGGGNNEGNNGNLLDLPYSEATPAQQKVKLSKEGEAVIEKIDGITEEKSAKLLASFSNKGDLLVDLLTGNSDYDTYTRANSTEQITKISSYYGEYEWDDVEEDWIKTDKNVTDKLIALFPADENSTTNNGKIEVTAVSSGVNINNNEVPSKVNADLYVNNTKEGNIIINATGINADEIVETANATAQLGTNYTLVANANKKGSNNKADAKFTVANETILSAEADLAAYITVNKIEDEDFENIKDGNVKVSITNDLTAVGYFNGAIIPELQKIDQEIGAIWDYNPNETLTAKQKSDKEKELEEKRVKLLNENMNLALVSTKDNCKIAKITIKLEAEPYYDSYDFSYQYILQFDDLTTVNADVFFGSGFTSLINKWEDFINKFN